MRISLVFYIFISISSISSAQKHDYNWVMGYEDFVNRGLGKVSRKNTLIIEDIITPIAVKHGNGRDWWLITGKKTTSLQYIYLIDPEGIHDPTVQDFGAVPGFPPEGTIAHVSPDGKCYAGKVLLL